MYNNLKCEQKVRNEIDRCTLDNSWLIDIDNDNDQWT